MINQKRIREKLRLDSDDSIFLLVNSRVNSTRYGFIYSINGEDITQRGVLMRNGDKIELSPEGKKWVDKYLDNEFTPHHIGKEELAIKTPKINHIKF